MKHFGFSLTESDVKTLILGLSVLPHLDFELDPIQQSINDALCSTCIDKISHESTDFSANEIRIIFCALTTMDEIIRGEWELEPALISECHNFMFNVNKLLPKFEKFLPTS